MTATGYWNRFSRRAASRRRLLQTGAASATGLTALALLACGGSNNNQSRSAVPSAAASRPATSVTSPQATVAGPARSTATASAQATTAAALPKKGGKLVINAAGADTPNLDIWASTSYFLHITGPGAVYSRLIKSKTGADVPALTIEAVGDTAQSWEQPDDTTYVFKLRPGIKFHNLAPVNARAMNAQDVVYSYTKQQATPGISVYLGTMDKLTAVDDSTVRMTSKTPSADFLTTILDGHNKIVAHEAVEVKGDLKDGPPIGTGGWMFADWTPNQITRFKRNPDYFRSPAPYPDEFNYLRVTDISTQKAAFRQKQILEFSGMKSDIDQLMRDSPELVLIEGKRFAPNVLIPKVTIPPLNDVRVRQAISKAINRKQILDTVFSGKGWELAGPSVPSVDWLLPDAELNSLLAYDPQGAKALLQAAGQTNLKIPMETQNIANPVAISELLQAQLKDVGIQVDISTIDQNKFASNTNTGNFTGITFGNLAFTTTTADLLAFWHTGGGRNGGGFSDPALDAMIDQQAALVRDVPTRKKLVLDVQRRVLDSLSIIPVATATGLSVHWPFLKGWSNPTLVWEYAQMEDAWLDQ